MPKALDAQVTPEFRRQVVEWLLPAAARHVGLSQDMATTTPVAPDLPIERLTMPVLLVSAADDQYKTADVVAYSATRIPGATTVILQTGGHALLGRQATVAHEVQQFLHAQQIHTRPRGPTRPTT